MNGTNNPDNGSRNKTQGSTPTIPVPPDNQGVLRETKCEHSDEKKQRTKKLFFDARSIDYLQLLVNLILAIVGICVLIIYWRQLEVFRGQFGEMQKQTGILNGQTQQAAMDAIESAKKTNLQLELVQRQVEVAQRSADVANRSLDEARANFAMDQRPWVFVNNFELSNEPEENKGIAVKYDVVNSGKSPAIDLIAQTELVISAPDPPMSTFDIPESSASRMLLPPSIGTGIGIGGSTASLTTNPSIVPKSYIDTYTAKTKILYIHVRLSYRDPYGKSHWTTICAFHKHGTPLGRWSFCAQGNGADQEKNKTKPN